MSQVNRANETSEAVREAQSLLRLSRQMWATAGRMGWAFPDRYQWLRDDLQSASGSIERRAHRIIADITIR